jgi:hypothetical protein
MEMAGKQTEGRSLNEEEENNDEEENIDEYEEERGRVRRAIESVQMSCNRYSSANMFSKFLDVTRQFTEMMEDTKKQQLMSRAKLFSLILRNHLTYLARCNARLRAVLLCKLFQLRWRMITISSGLHGLAISNSNCILKFLSSLDIGAFNL